MFRNIVPWLLQNYKDDKLFFFPFGTKLIQQWKRFSMLQFMFLIPVGLSYGPTVMFLWFLLEQRLLSQDEGYILSLYREL